MSRNAKQLGVTLTVTVTVTFGRLFILRSCSTCTLTSQLCTISSVFIPLDQRSANERPGSYVVSQDIYWFETMYGKCLHKRTNQRSNHYMRRRVTGNTTYLGATLKSSAWKGLGVRKYRISATNSTFLKPIKMVAVKKPSRVARFVKLKQKNEIGTHHFLLNEFPCACSLLRITAD